MDKKRRPTSVKLYRTLWLYLILIKWRC